MHLRTALMLLLAAASAAGCAPRFQGDSSITIDGAAFQPTMCNVLAGAQGGIVLVDAAGTRLTLGLPPARLDAWREIAGAPHARLEPAGGKPPVDLGACGSLTLRGEGYHGSGRRAASGNASLSCSGGAAVRGDIHFTGCF
jgi:type 1 fimbria pilin